MIRTLGKRLRKLQWYFLRRLGRVYGHHYQCFMCWCIDRYNSDAYKDTEPVGVSRGD